jgi:hypothetical protein
VHTSPKSGHRIHLARNVNQKSFGTIFSRMASGSPDYYYGFVEKELVKVLQTASQADLGSLKDEIKYRLDRQDPAIDAEFMASVLRRISDILDWHEVNKTASRKFSWLQFLPALKYLRMLMSSSWPNKREKALKKVRNYLNPTVANIL